jgi:hypothetical protein
MEGDTNNLQNQAATTQPAANSDMNNTGNLSAATPLNSPDTLEIPTNPTAEIPEPSKDLNELELSPSSAESTMPTPAPTPELIETPKPFNSLSEVSPLSDNEPMQAANSIETSAPANQTPNSEIQAILEQEANKNSDIELSDNKPAAEIASPAEPSQPQINQQSEPQTFNTPAPEKKSNGKLWLTVAGVVVLIIIAVVYFLFKNGSLVIEQ